MERITSKEVLSTCIDKYTKEFEGKIKGEGGKRAIVVCGGTGCVAANTMGIKEKYGRKLILTGGWDLQGPISYPETPDEELKEALKVYVDTFAPDGGFCYMPVVVGNFTDEPFQRKMKLINDF